MGANEVAEGLIRMAVTAEGAERGADLFADGAMKRQIGGEKALAVRGGRPRGPRDLERSGISRSLRAPKRSARPRRWTPWLRAWTSQRTNTVAIVYDVKMQSSRRYEDSLFTPRQVWEHSCFASGIIPEI